MKKVLILTCSTGEGHNSAAYAVRRKFVFVTSCVCSINFTALRQIHLGQK